MTTLPNPNDPHDGSGRSPSAQERPRALASGTILPEQRGVVVEIWKETLGVADVDLDRGFADLGGTSVAANQFVAKLSRRLGVALPVLRVFEYPTLRLLLRFLSEGSTAHRPIDAPAEATGARASAGPGVRAGHDVAVVGMACRFPGAKNLEEFWANLLDARDTISTLRNDELSPEVPEDLRTDPRYVRACGLIDQPYAMDNEFFDMNPMEAKLTDPQQRILLETAWQALEHAGEAPGRTVGLTAVYAGVEDNSYYKAEILPFPEAEKRAGRFAVMTGNEKDYVAMRIAHRLNLKGPAVSVHTACSTSLVAVIMACKSLRQRECDLALAGGAAVHFPTPEGYYYQEGGVFSPDGHTRPFDQAARGTNFTDGAGIVVLKRVEDALRDRNTIFAVIKGGAINNDGAERASFSAPSVAGQSSCILAALADAGVDAGTIQYLEAHGTATPVGDPIEVEALRQAFATRKDSGRNQYCGLGSVKSNIGHTTAAAGVASLIKTALALRHGVIPATVHFQRPNPALDLENSPFYIVSEKLDWPRGEPARRAGVSSFGIGGTNSHLVLEEAPLGDDGAAGVDRPLEIWPVSAKSAAQRDRLLQALAAERYWPRDVAHTLQAGRARFRYRGARVRVDQLAGEDLVVQPAQAALEEPRPVFLFPGQGSQYIEMGRSLYELVPEFRTTFARCCAVLSDEMQLNFKDFIFDAANQETLENTRYTQPALFAIEASLGKMLLEWGVRPALMLGHSVGEFAAAHLAGVFSLEDALRLIAARGRLMAGLPRGRMLSARGALEAVIAAAGEPVDIASVNGPVHCVLAGDNQQIDRVQQRLETAGVPCRVLHTSHAFHSAMMAPVVEPFLAIVRSVDLHPPRMPIISTVTGELMSAANATDPRYWANHLRSTVKFSPALFDSIGRGGNLFVEVGPRTTLTSLAVQHFVKARKAEGECIAIPLLGEQADPQSELVGVGTALAKLWCAGVELAWDSIWPGGRKVPLASSYPFERKDFRFSEGRGAVRRAAAPASAEPAAEEPAPPVALHAADAVGVEQRLAAELGTLFGDYSGLSVERLDATFVECGFDSLVLMQIAVELGKKYGVSIALRDLMERLNTLTLLAKHIASAAAPDRLRHLPAATVPGPAPAVQRAPVEQAAAAARPAPALEAGPAGNGSAAPPLAQVSADVARVIHQQLTMMKDIIELQLRYLEQAPHAAPASSTAAPVVSSATPVAAATEPLIRARHAEPPSAGAFRAPGRYDESAWYAFDTERRHYAVVRP
jgi:acyl transferase domain-containing protein